MRSTSHTNKSAAISRPPAICNLRQGGLDSKVPPDCDLLLIEDEQGIAGVTPHVLEHTAITWTVMNGVGVEDAAE